MHALQINSHSRSDTIIVDSLLMSAMEDLK